MLAVARFASGSHRPRPQQDLEVRTRPYLRQSARRIDWREDSTARVLRTLRAADSQPGVLDDLLGEQWYLHGGHPEDQLRGRPGAILATRAQAICRATADGAVWIPQLRARRAPGARATLKLPATLALDDPLPPVPEVPAPLELPPGRGTFSEIRYQEQDGVGFVRFAFPGGAMSTVQCRRLLAAYRFACTRPTRVLVLGGARDFFSNGIHLGVIEASAHPADESWANIQAMDDVVEAVLATTDRLVVAALAGNAAAGGVMLALAADEVWCRSGCVLNPHYRLMGLPGSEYATYTLPRRVGPESADALLREAQPLSAATARRLGLVDHVLLSTPATFAARVAQRGRAPRRRPGDPPADHREEGRPCSRRGRQAAELLPQGGAGPDAPHLLRPRRALPRPARRLRAQGAAAAPRGGRRSAPSGRLIGRSLMLRRPGW